LSPYPIAVVIATRVGWPKINVATDPTLPQLASLRGQLVIADASGQPPAPWAKGNDAVTWLSLPGRTPYELRQAGYAAARAKLIAVTEDHCAPSSDWVANILAAHEADPDAAAIFGMVDNGSREHLIDWALFGAGYLSMAPPAPARRGSPGHANLSFKSEVLESVAASGDTVLEFRYLEKLRNAGRRVVGSDRLLVTHVQSSGLAGTSRLFFHNGRYIAALRRDRMTAMDWVRTLAPGLIAGYRTLRTLSIARSKPKMTDAVYRSAPLIAMLHAIHAGGESVGYITGAGDSARYLH
jgi:hypothetical protein